MRLSLKQWLAVAHLLLAALYLVFVLFGTWAKRETNEGVFSSEGGTGFGIVAVVLGVLLIILAVMRLTDRSRVLPGVGVEQLTVMLGLAATLNLIGWIVGWRAVFPAGTGWGVVAAYFPASFIPQVGMLTLSTTEPGQGISELQPNRRQAYSVMAALAAAGVALFPLLTWLTSGSVSLTGYDGRAGNPTSGPRLSYILLIVGAVVFVGALMRLRPRGLAEPGPNLLLSHALLAGGLIALLQPLATLISVFQTDGLDPGIGIWLGMLAGLVLIALAVIENRERRAVGA